MQRQVQTPSSSATTAPRSKIEMGVVHQQIPTTVEDALAHRQLAILYERGGEITSPLRCDHTGQNGNNVEHSGPHNEEEQSIKPNLRLALHHYELAASAGDPESHNCAGEILLAEAVAKGHADAQQQMLEQQPGLDKGDELISPASTEPSAEEFEAAMTHFKAAAAAKHPDGMYNLAQMILFCLDGCDETIRDSAAESAVELLYEAAETEHIGAERELGTLLYLLFWVVLLR